MSKNLNIRNSTAEFLIFTSQSQSDSIEVKYQDETVWLSQKMMAKLFAVTIPTINEHLQNIFSSNELDKNSVIRNFLITASDGKKYNTNFYNLDVIISVGYRVNSHRATQFRIWATKVLHEFAIKGYVLDKKRLENGSFINKKFFDTLIEEIREIRASERNFYQKITDIYATSIDYNKKDSITKEFFAAVQNKLHFAVHGKTAAELVKTRADKNQKHMGLRSWKHYPDGRVIKTDVVIAKNYLSKEELRILSRIVTMYLDYAEDQAQRKIPMTMEDWAEKLNGFLKFNEREVLDSPGKVTAELAKQFAESQFEEYRITQDKLFESDFDKFSKKLLEKNKK
ncbi:virulence RhuM family protein [archaeon]|jgi:hypothetical protein|nr:virulence RhuM family protein [archaeon]MBT6762069.1 virulence RhuM family protein [archaeon]